MCPLVFPLVCVPLERILTEVTLSLSDTNQATYNRTVTSAILECRVCRLGFVNHEISI